MDVTTIKLHKDTKQYLDQLRTKQDTYDSVIKKLFLKDRRKDLKRKLSEAYKSLGVAEIKTLNEWESASGEID